MSLKTVSQAMQYEASGSKKINTNKAAIKLAETIGTPSLIWLLVRRHKVGLLAVGNIVLVLNWIFPEWVEFVSSMF